MLKFLRLYSKWILAVFGSLLMITFLAPTAIQEFFAQRAAKGTAWAEIGPDGKKLSDETRMEASADLAVVEGFDRQLWNLVDRRDTGHWYLLSQAADDAGLVPPRGSLALSPEEAQLIFGRVGLNAANERALARYDGIRTMLGMWQVGASLSDRRIEGLAARLFHTVDARVAVLEASSDGMPMPSDADIAAHYAEYADVEPGEGQYGFGYRRPDRVSLEFLHIPVEAIDASVEAAGDLNIIELSKHWKSAAAEKGFPPFELGVDIPDVVRRDLLTEREESARRQIEKWLTSRQLEGSRSLGRDENGYLALPDDWSERKLDFVAMVEELPEAFPGLDGISYRADGALRPVTSLTEDTDFPTGTTSAFGGSRSLATLLPGALELGGDGTILLQQDVTGPIMSLPDGGLVLFRITDADGARAPRDLDEVRDEVTDDLKRLTHYRELLAQRESIEATAEQSGLLAVAVDRDAELARVNNISIIDPSLYMQLQGRLGARSFTQFPAIGANDDLVAEMVDAAMSLAGDGQALGTLPTDQRIQTFAADSSLAVAVAEFTGQTRLDRASFEGILSTPGTLPILLQEEFGDISADLEEAFGFEALKERYQFKPLTRDSDEDDIDLGLAGDDEG